MEMKNIFDKIIDFFPKLFKKEVQEEVEMNYYDDIPLEEVESFLSLPLGVKIIFNFKYIYSNADERESYKRLVEIFKRLEKHNRRYNIEIKVGNRELLNKSRLLDYVSNIDLIINNDLYKYTLEEYLKEEEKIDKMVYPIKYSNLSPYEKYLAVYNIVKQYNNYKENLVCPAEARYLRYILKDDYIVCVGFSNLLNTMLNKIDIPCMRLCTLIRSSRKSVVIDGCVFPWYIGHERNVIKLDDDKYNIHGIYVVDATWDNKLDTDLYNHANMIFDMTKEFGNLEIIKQTDWLLDFHNFEEYCYKINIYLKRKIQNIHDNYQDGIIDAYDKIYKEIMKILYKLDYNKWKFFLDKYGKMIDDYNIKYKNDNSFFKEFETLYQNFLTEYGYYIILLSNKKISDEVMYEAASQVKKEINGLSDEEINLWKEETKENNNIRKQNVFPYIYDSHNKRDNYLEVRKKNRVRKK